MKTLPTVQIPGINIRLARPTSSEIVNIAELEKEVWGNNAADADKILNRLNVFPDGSYVAEDGRTKKIVGYVCFQQVDDLRTQDSLNWSMITDNGWTTGSHRVKGGYLYGIDMSVHYSMNGKKLGAALVSQCFLYMIAERKAGIFTGSRIPMFKRYQKRCPKISAEEYMKLRRGEKFYDYELNLYHQTGLAPINVKALPNFFPDEDSLNYGVLIFDDNPFRNYPAAEIDSLIELLINQDFINLKKRAQK